MRKAGSRFSALFVGYVLGAATGAACVAVYLNWIDPRLAEFRPLERRSAANAWTSPLLDCRHPAAEMEDLALKNSFSQSIRQLESRGDMKIAVLASGFRTGYWTSFGEDEPFLPGSLNKVALLVAYLKTSEEIPGFFDQKIKFSDDRLLGLYELQGVRPSTRLNVGKSYAIRELIEAAITRSDNVAAMLLERYDDRAMLKRLSLELDIPLHEGHPPHRPITLQEYSVIFKVLFNSTYLNQENSAFALRLMSRSEFRDGIVAGVPPHTEVAHKFGEAIDSQGNRQFSQCGIFATGLDPYLLCLSVKGRAPEQKMIEAAAQISRVAYDSLYMPAAAAAKTTQANATQ